jgi:8-oxo-dGTP diphosphatase
MITRRGAMVVVLTPDRRQVLLLRRQVFVLWDLPGGGVEKGELPIQAAARECREETGYQVEIDRPVGRYLHQSVYGSGDQLTHVFRAHVVGGKPNRIGLELTGLRWCDVAALPRGLQPLQRQMIADALADAAEPFERRIDFPVWKLYPARVIFSLLRAVNASIRKLTSWFQNVSRS